MKMVCVSVKTGPHSTAALIKALIGKRVPGGGAGRAHLTTVVTGQDMPGAIIPLQSGRR